MAVNPQHLPHGPTHPDAWRGPAPYVVDRPMPAGNKRRGRAGRVLGAAAAAATFVAAGVVGTLHFTGDTDAQSGVKTDQTAPGGDTGRPSNETPVFPSDQETSQETGPWYEGDVADRLSRALSSEDVAQALGVEASSVTGPSVAPAPGLESQNGIYAASWESGDAGTYVDAWVAPDTTEMTELPNGRDIPVMDDFWGQHDSGRPTIYFDVTLDGNEYPAAAWLNDSGADVVARLDGNRNVGVRIESIDPAITYRDPGYFMDTLATVAGEVTGMEPGITEVSNRP